MKRNKESESGSSDEERISLKKAKKENFGNEEMSESDNTELIDGSEKGIANSNVKIEAPLPELKDVKGLYIGNPDQKFLKDKAENDGGHENGSIEEIENRNDEDIIREMELISKSFIIGSKEYSYSGNTEVRDILEESICSEEETYVDDNMEGEDSVINEKECIILADKLTRLFRSIYYDTKGKIREEETINKCQSRRNIDGNVDIQDINADKGERYSSIREEACSDEEFNNSYDCGETSDINYEINDEGFGKEVSDYSSDNDIRNERHDTSNNSSFRARNSTNIESERCERNLWEESKNIFNTVTNDGGLGKEKSGDTYYNGVQGDEQANRNGEKENDVTKETETFADCLSNANFKECRTSDEQRDSITNMEMRNGEGERNNSEVNYKSDNSDLISEEASTSSYGIENNSSFEGFSTDLGGMSTDEECSWSDESKSSSYVDTDSSDKEEVDDESSTDESSTDQSSDTSSVEDDSTDDSTADSTDEEYDSSSGREDNNDWSTTDESLREDTNTSYDEEIDSYVSPLGNDENTHALSSYKLFPCYSCSSTEEENGFGCANARSTPETAKNLGDSENIKNEERTKRCSEANEESDSAENNPSDNEDSEISFDSVLGFLSYRRFSVEIPGEETISVRVASVKLMPLKDYFRESVDGRRKKRNAARRKDIKTPSVGENGKIGMRGRNAVKNKFGVQNKAAETSDSGELSDEEMEEQVRNNRSRKIRNRKSKKELEQDDSRDEDDEDGEDYPDDKGDEDSSGVDGEDNGEGLEDEEEEDYGEDVSDSEDEEYDEGDEEDEERDVDEGEEQDSEDVDGENDEDFEGNEEEDDIEDVDTQVENEDDSDESSDNDKNQYKIKQTKSRTMFKKKETKEPVRGKRNVRKRGVK